MRSNPIHPDPSEPEELGIKTSWTAPCRGMQPLDFAIPHSHEVGPKAAAKTTQDVAQLVADVAEMREEFSRKLSEIQQKLSQGKQRFLRPRGRKQAGKVAGQPDLPFLPADLSPISEAIERSKIIFSRPPDPSDDLGLACSQDTWRRAIRILMAHALSIWENARVVIRPPIISAGPDGSVDLYWTAAPYGLLLNVPADPQQPATYYGDDAANPDSNHTSGKLDSTRLVDVGILMWLAHTAQQ